MTIEWTDYKQKMKSMTDLNWDGEDEGQEIDTQKEEVTGKDVRHPPRPPMSPFGDEC